MAETESVNTRPKCDWPVTTKDASGTSTTEKCKSEQNVFNVSGKGLYTGRERKSDICGEHVGDAMKKWNWESAEKYPSKRTGA
jgi:hypothetical protein